MTYLRRSVIFYRTRVSNVAFLFLFNLKSPCVPFIRALVEERSTKELEKYNLYAKLEWAQASNARLRETLVLF